MNSISATVFLTVSSWRRYFLCLVWAISMLLSVLEQLARHVAN